MKQATQQTAISVSRGGKTIDKIDCLVIEEPLEIVLAYYVGGTAQRYSLAITMRTPGDDFELVRGFLYSEGIIRRQADIIGLSHLGTQALKEGTSNVVLASLSPSVKVNVEGLQRNFTMNSACGVCGKASLEALEIAGAQPILDDSFSIAETTLVNLPEVARKIQDVYRDTGGTHAAAAFDRSGRIACLREDIGRHNATDKLIGALCQEPAATNTEMGIFVSGRASFELLQKAAMARLPFLAAVGAPSSLAVELAREFEITLVGFLRKDKFNIYNRPDRVRFL